ncbi:glycoside hydrolase family 18 protein [Treponema phagedenis]|uniref:glycoside hydrolase family 18 protein n=1 Tax=Treponema phagedenis TaxID=162 RepID=UPI00197DDFCC|nr:glycosyl hydrolase family 18 protein [Treponema phagedenis]QSH95121.1 chitinase [Treponema phagedenis]
MQFDTRKLPCKLLAYVDSGRGWTPEQICAYPITNLCYAFGRIVNGAVSTAHFTMLDKLWRIKELRPDIRIQLSIGGWTAEGFSDAALTKESRALFVRSAYESLKDSPFEGLDIDWEYPGSDAAGIKARKEDRENYTALMTELREMLDRLQLANGKKPLLTMALGAGEKLLNDIEMQKLLPVMDFVNVMTYDLCTSSPKTRHHTCLKSPSYDPEQISLEKETKLLLVAGIPREKIILGGSFYGRLWHKTRNEGTGLFQDSGQGVAAFEDFGIMLKNQLKDPAYKQYWDESAEAAYLFNGETFISYDNERSLKAKMRYVIEEKLGGFVFWEFSCDDSGTLITALSEALLAHST